MENKDLIGKKFKSIKENGYGGFQIKFLDNTIAHFEFVDFPDSTQDKIYRDKILELNLKK
jgi:hypothetical protein